MPSGRISNMGAVMPIRAPSIVSVAAFFVGIAFANAQQAELSDEEVVARTLAVVDWAI